MSGEDLASMTMSDADKVFQQDLTLSMAKALAGGLMAKEDAEDLHTWARRYDAIRNVADAEYGEDVGQALTDQAFAIAEEWLRTLQAIASLTVRPS